MIAILLEVRKLKNRYKSSKKWANFIVANTNSAKN